MKDWRDYIKFPLKRQDNLPFWIVDSNGNHVLDCFIKDQEEADKALEIINANVENEYVLLVFRMNLPVQIREGHRCELIKDNKPYMRIRGWGYLTGIGVKGLHLPEEEAIEIQDEFRDYVLRQVNKLY